MLTITERLRTGEEAMMRKIMTLLVFAGLSLGLCSAVLENDGSLHIDTSLNQGVRKRILATSSKRASCLPYFNQRRT